MVEYALGMIETKGLVAAIEAADAALKAAKVKLVSKEKVKGGIINIKIIGEVAAVQSAVDAGTAAAKRVGELLASHVIPRPIEDLEHLIFDASIIRKKEEESVDSKEITESDKLVAPGDMGSHVEGELPEDMEDEGAVQLSIDYSELSAEDVDYLNELQKLNVQALRRLARDTEGLSIFGRQISIANKSKLINELMKARLKK
jgi:ethanolamine utilization protein EutM